MRTAICVLLGLVPWTFSFSVAQGQEDGACAFPLVLSAAVQSQLEDILFESFSGFGPADHGLAAPLVTIAPVADGQISPGEYPNTCFYPVVA